MRGVRTGSVRRFFETMRRCMYGRDAGSGGFNSVRFSREKLDDFTRNVEEKTKMTRRWLDLYGSASLAGTAAYNSWKGLRKCGRKLRTAMRPSDPVTPIDDAPDPCPNPFVQGG